MRKENFVVITFSDESNAIEGLHKMQDLAMRGDIAIGYNIMLKKNDDGEIEAMKKVTHEGVDTWSGMLIGMLVGLFAGPFGFMISMLAGTAIGAGFDYSKTHFEDGFVDGVKAKLADGKIAIVANCEESSPDFLDDALKALDANIQRTIATNEKK